MEGIDNKSASINRDGFLPPQLSELGPIEHVPQTTELKHAPHAVLVGQEGLSQYASARRPGRHSEKFWQRKGRGRVMCEGLKHDSDCIGS